MLALVSAAQNRKSPAYSPNLECSDGVLVAHGIGVHVRSSGRNETMHLK